MKKTVIIGNLGQDAQVKQTQTGQQFLGFTVAVSEKRNGQESTTWFSCSAWGDRFVTGAVGQYLKKGTKVYLEGNYNPSLFNAQDGSVQISHNLMVNQIELLGSVPQGQPQQTAQQPVQAQAPIQQPVQQSAQQPVYQQQATTFQNPTQPIYTPGSGHRDDMANAGVTDDDIPF